MLDAICFFIGKNYQKYYMHAISAKHVHFYSALPKSLSHPGKKTE